MNKTSFMFALSSGTLWGIMGLFTRILSADFGFTSLQIASIRLTVAAISFVVVSLIHHRDRFKIKIKDTPTLFAMGVSGLMLLSLTYFLSIKYSSMAIAASLMYTAPAIVIVASLFLFKEKLTSHKILSLIAAFIGSCFVSGLFISGKSVTVGGVVFGLLAGIFYASYSIFGTYALRKHNSGTATLWAFIFAAAFSLLFVNIPDFITKIIASENKLKLVLLALGMGFFTGYLPYLLYTTALERSNASKTVIVASVEPLVAALFGFVAFGESLSFHSAIGITLILISVILTTKN